MLCQTNIRLGLKCLTVKNALVYNAAPILFYSSLKRFIVDAPSRESLLKGKAQYG